MSYQAGSLELSILGFSDEANRSINATAKSLGSLHRVLSKIEQTNVAFSVHRLEALFRGIAKSTSAINTANISNLASAAKSLNSITKFANLEKMDFAKIGNGFASLSVAIQPFLDKVKEAEAGLTALEGVLRSASGKKIQGLMGVGGYANANANKGGGVFGLVKKGITIHVARRVGVALGKIVNAGSDYIETMNLWQVAMRENLDLADEFVNKMNKAYGVSTKTTMQAQATFKNMIGSLGDLSNEAAYQLSEAITMMAYDYASLYNVDLAKAVDKFQSALAGQVRPIRSISGYDITEKTIHALYQSIGGTKTQRQLSRTEKQLLAILAVFRQMQASGATGDLGKTLNNFANQSRMLKENFAELKSWTGLLLVDLLEGWQVTKGINAAFIALTQIVKSFAKARGVGDKNFVDGIFESAESANEELAELQGRLLDFDKFRALETQNGASDVSIDEKLLSAISGYTSLISNATNEARELARTWLKLIGYTEDENGDLVITEGRLKLIELALKAIGAALFSAFGLFATAIVVRFGTFVTTYAIKPLGELLAKVIALIPKMSKLEMVWVGLGAAIFAASLTKFFKTEMSSAKRIITMFTAIAAAIAAAAISLHLFQQNYAMAFGLAATVAGGVLQVSSSIPNFEKGASDIDSGTIFRAGEFGKTEAVYTGSNGKTNVANVRQMEQAFYNALSRHSREGNGTIVVQTYLDGDKVYENTTAKARARGNVWSKV